MIGWFKLAIVLGGLVVAGLVLWINVAPQTRSVSWYLAHPTERTADYAWCQEHPGGGVLHVLGPDCETVADAKLHADADAFLAAMPKPKW
jgi:hypothetical protein